VEGWGSTSSRFGGRFTQSVRDFGCAKRETTSITLERHLRGTYKGAIHGADYVGEVEGGGWPGLVPRHFGSLMDLLKRDSTPIRSGGCPGGEPFSSTLSSDWEFFAGPDLYFSKRWHWFGPTDKRRSVFVVRRAGDSGSHDWE